MNQGHKLLNGNSRFKSRAILKNLTGNLTHRTFGKIELSQTYLCKEHISNKIIKGLPASDLESIFSAADSVYLGSHEYIYQPDDLVRFLYFPETAVISEFQILEDGRTVEVAMTGSEGMVGIASILNSRTSPNWFQVLIPGKALRIDSQFCRQKLNCCDAFQELVFDFVNLYISQISQRVICNNHHTVEERLCFWLLMVSDRCGHDSLPLTQELIARFLGVHRPSITLITQSLRDKGVIDYIRGKISILDKHRLKDLSCVCYETVVKNQKSF